MKKKKIKQRNFVQEYSLMINQATVFTDRKKQMKKGYVKHKKDILSSTTRDNKISFFISFYFLNLLISKDSKQTYKLPSII
ncbi:DUF7230 family protein [Succinivibrio faecicola]|uniref:DUF7230 family protein n=1 Tax=Succinivibrio TaxID=83770 RepID=UPI003AB9648F